MFATKFTRYLERRDEEDRKRDEEARKRDEEARKRDEEARKRDEEGRARWAELRRLRERDEELREKAEARAEENREFNREILLRNEKVYTSLIAEMEEGIKQLRANTQAVLSVLDRLNGSSA